MDQQHDICAFELMTTSEDLSGLEALLSTPSAQDQDMNDSAVLQPNLFHLHPLSATPHEQPSSEKAQDARHMPSRPRRARNREVNRRDQRNYRNRQKVTTSHKLPGCID